jgi:predicted acyl esterase
LDELRRCYRQSYAVAHSKGLARTPMPAQALQPREVKIRVHDGVEIAVALYMPEGNGPFPVLFAPSPYRYDNNALPAGPQFLWRETGPIEFYLAHGYVYANMDVRGCGKSGGEFRLLDRAEQNGLATSRGRAARSAVSASPISACRNGGWRSRNRRR